MDREYWNPTRRIIADGALNQLPELLALFQPKKILLLLGKASFRGSPRHQQLLESLSGFHVEEPAPVERNPSVVFVQEMWRSLRGKPYDLVVGIGGGSVLDCAKVIRILLKQEEAVLEDYVENRKEFRNKGLPFIAVPTTAGTGSEVTPYASLQTRARHKISLTHPWLYPEVALVDPTLTYSMPGYVTACSGLDALSQAIESFWSVRHTPFSDAHSLRAIPLALENFPKVLKDPGDRPARFAMSLASTEAGLAISQTRTTAPHAVSYPLTTFFEIPHGHACALTLPSFIRYNGPVLGPERAPILWRAMGSASHEEAAQVVERLMEAAGVERSLRKLGLGMDGIDTVIEHGFRSDRVVNNPREVTKEALREILERIY
ncbi:MAG: iron-containing alcohol dehydrogenase [Candidatus Omnitrophica bacterium]|nr:iron-containing alcohol dehydrogenase [Candidatus Omnitrophota bacterium]